MAVEFIGSGTTIPAHQADDLIIAFLAGRATTLASTVPSGWTGITDVYGSGFYAQLLQAAYTVATSASTPIPTWDRATGAYYAVYRGVDKLQPIGGFSSNVSGTTSITVPAVTLQKPNDNLVAAVFAYYNATTTTAPPWMVFRSSGGRLAGHDTNGPVSSQPAFSYSVSNAYTTNVIAVEIRSGILKTTAGAVSLALDVSGTGVKSRSLTNPVVGNVLENVPMNGTFDTSTAGWYFSFFGEPLGTGTSDTAFKRTGAASLKLQTTRDLGSGLWSATAWYQVLTSLVPGARYRATAWVWLEPGVDQAWITNWFDYDYPSTATTVTGQWVQLVAEGVPTRDVFDLAVECHASSSSGIVWVDDVKVERVMEPLDVALTVVGEVVRVYGISGTAAAASTTGGSFSKRSSLSGTVGAVSTTSGGITLIPGSVTYQVTGTVAVVSTTAALPNIRAPTTGTVAVVSTTAGNATRLLLTLPASGTAPVTSATSGALTKRTAASGTSAVVSSVQGDATRLLLTLAVSGTATVASTVAGALTKQTTASATSSVVSATDGDVLRVGIIYGISGTAAAVSTTSGDAARSLLTLPITGTTAVSSTTAGSITARAQIAGTSSTVSTVSGAATREPRTFPIGGTSPAQSVAAGALTALLQGAGTSAVVSTTAAAQSLRAKIAGQNTLLTTSAGDIDATRVVLGTISVLSVVAGDPVIYVAPSIPAYPGLPYPGTTWPSYETATPGQVKVGSLNQKVPAQVYRSGTWKRAPVKVFKSGTWKETL